jgi:hypothetical protein
MKSGLGVRANVYWSWGESHSAKARKGNGHPDYTGRHSMYRFHVEDPVTFDKSLRVTIEHGQANDRSDDYSSVAYWYQSEPHKRFPALPAMADRLPIDRWTAVPIR